MVPDSSQERLRVSVVRQTAVDYMQLIRILRSFDGKKTWDLDVNLDGEPDLAGDFDGDGFVDLFVGGYEDLDAGIAWPFQILINEKGRSFKLIQSKSYTRARGITACDFDQDGDLDVYVSNYRLQPNLLWQKRGDKGFVDVAKEYDAQGTSPGFAGGHSIGNW